MIGGYAASSTTYVCRKLVRCRGGSAYFSMTPPIRSRRLIRNVEIGNGAGGGWSGAAGERAVELVLVAVALVLAERVQQVVPAPDERSVQQFAAGAADPPFHDRVRTWHLDGAS